MFLPAGSRSRSGVITPGMTSARRGEFALGMQLLPPSCGRLTLTTATPVLTTTTSAKTTLYFTPYLGNMTWLYNGTAFVPYFFNEISVLTTDTTKNPAAIGASKVNDWFLWDDSGILRLTHSVDWTNDTTRASSLTLKNGVYLNTSAIANGPQALRGTYVGTTRSNSSSQLDMIFGGSASGGTAGFFGVWNMYNRIQAVATVTDSGTTYTYTSATVRQARASAGNQVSFILGLNENPISASYSWRGTTTNANGAFQVWGCGLDVTTTMTTQRIYGYNNATSAVNITSGTHNLNAYAGLGFHFVSANEASDGTNANSYNGDNGNVLIVTVWL